MSKSQREVRAVDITDGEFFSIDLISKVESEDGLRASIHQTFHWSTGSVHKRYREVEHQAMPQIPSFFFLPESTKSQIQTR